LLHWILFGNPAGVVRVYRIGANVKVWPDKPLFARVFRSIWVRRFVFVVLIALVAVWGALYSTSCYKRAKVERLLHDVSTFPENGSLASALELAKRYRGEPEGACDGHYCSVAIWIGNLGPRYLLTRSTVVDFVGLRPWFVRATVSVREGSPASSYLVLLGKGRGELHHDGWFGTAIWAELGAGWSASGDALQEYHKSLRDHGREDPHNNEFVVNKPCLTTYGGGEVLTVLRNSHPAAQLKYLDEVNLDCLTSFRPCTELCQTMPAAWKEFVSRGAHGCMDAEALNRARRACGNWAGDVGH
jgi:hypothetical protein